MKKLVCFIMILCLSFPAFATQTDIANSVVDAFDANSFQKIESMLSDEVRASVGAEQLEQAFTVWEFFCMEPLLSSERSSKR